MIMDNSTDNTFLNLIDWENHKLQRNLLINDLKFHFQNCDDTQLLKMKTEKIRMRLIRDLIWIHNFIGIPCDINPYEGYMEKTTEYNSDLKLQIKKTLKILEEINSFKSINFNKKVVTEKYTDAFTKLELIRANLNLLRNLYVSDEVYIFDKLLPIKELIENILSEHEDFIKLHTKHFREDFQKQIKTKKFTVKFSLLLTSILSFTSEIDMHIYKIENTHRQNVYHRKLSNNARDSFINEISDINNIIDKLKKVDVYLTKSV